LRKIDEIKFAIYSLLQKPIIRKSASACFFASRPAPRSSIISHFSPLSALRALRPAPRFFIDIAPLGLRFLSPTTISQALRTWLMISPRWGCAAKT
jgi:hypothetical protein